MTLATINAVTRRLLIGLCLNLLTFSVQAGIDITYIHNDALGSAVAGTDEQGAVKWRSQYAPYGEERLGERSAFGIRSGYTGHRDDPETGLTYMGARYYSPTIGRFMGVDPAGVDETDIYSFNRYAYANNNPYRYVDPDGKAIVQAVRTAFWAGTRIGALINAGTEAAFGASLGILIFDALHNESSDESNSRSTDDPVDLEEDLAGKEILGDFANGGGRNINDEMKDPRFGPNGTHDKLSGHHDHPDGTVTEIHADRNRKTGELSNTKFKTGTDNKKSRQ